LGARWRKKLCAIATLTQPKHGHGFSKAANEKGIVVGILLRAGGRASETGEVAKATEKASFSLSVSSTGKKRLEISPSAGRKVAQGHFATEENNLFARRHGVVVGMGG